MQNVSRRSVLAGAASALILPRPGFAAMDETTVTAAPASVQLVPPGYGQTDVWAYDGAVPGAGLRVAQGTRIRRTFVNALPQPSTIHWHGIRIDNAMDGAAGLTQPEVPPGAEFVYDFAVPDAGTDWFHPHRNTLEQVARGLAAPLIVEETDAPEVDHDLVLTINDWRLDDAARIVEDFGNMHDASHDGRIGNYLTVNGQYELAQTVAQNQRLRLRVINAASDRILRLAPAGLAGMVVALDGMPLAAPVAFDAVVLSPAQRVDLILDVTAAAGEPAYLLSVERDGSYALANFTVQGAAAPVRPAIMALPPNRWVAPQLNDARSARLLMEGGMMGGMAGASLPDGTARSIQELFGAGLAWALNGVAGMPDAPLIEVARGETVRLPVINRSVFAHAMHLHGHHFQELTEAGLGPARDTILVEGEAQTEIAFVAENPGDWMFHCHMLAHQAAGMMTWIRVLS